MKIISLSANVSVQMNNTSFHSCSCSVFSLWTFAVLYEIKINNAKMSSQPPSPQIESPQLAQRRSRSPLRSENGSQRAHSAPTSSLSAAMIDYTNLRYEFVAGKRVDSKMLHTVDERQMYRFRVARKTFSQYDCYVAKCPAKVSIHSATNVCSPKTVDRHNHGPNEEIEAIQLNDAIKKRCRSAAVAAKCGGNVHDVFNNTILE